MVLAARRRDGTCRCRSSTPRCAAAPSEAGPGRSESAAIRVEAHRDDAERLALMLPGDDVPLAPTHWSFGQLASLVGAPATYLRQLPAPLAGINLQYGLTSHRAELVKTLEAEDGRVELRAVTGPDYGRIYDHELVAAVQRIAGDGTGDTRWKVPGVLDWSTRRLQSAGRRHQGHDDALCLGPRRLPVPGRRPEPDRGRARCPTARPTSTSAASTAGTPRSARRRSASRASISGPSARTAISGVSRTSRRSPSATRNLRPHASPMRRRQR